MGGSALQVNASGNNNLVFVRSSAEIFAGGGGGGGGGGGAQGDSFVTTGCTNGPYSGWPYRGGCGGACSAAMLVLMPGIYLLLSRNHYSIWWRCWRWW